MKNILQSHVCLLFLSMTTFMYGAHNKPGSPSYLRDTPRSTQRRQFALEKRAALEQREMQDISYDTPPRSRKKSTDQKQMMNSSSLSISSSSASPKKSNSQERTIYSAISYAPQSPTSVTRSQSCHTPTRKARVSAHKLPNKFPQFVDDTSDKLRASQEIQMRQVVQEAYKLSVLKLLPTPSHNDTTELRKLCAQDLKSTSEFIEITIPISKIF